MKIIAAFDSFKGSLTSREAGEACRDGILRVIPDADVDVVCVGDGGEGTVDAIASTLGADIIDCPSVDSLGRDISARYALAGNVAAIETAAASGLTLLSPSERKVMKTSSRGTGILVADAIARGADTIILGLGGSATCDGGTGLLSALGVRFLDSAGNPTADGGASLARIASIDTGGLPDRIKDVKFILACDVDNPLLGNHGAARVFAPQKGASPDDVEILEAGMRNFADIASQTLGRDRRDMPGAGAAGGIGFALATFFNARPGSGIDTVLDAIDFDRRIAGADIVFTGEGRLDSQTLGGKTPFGILKRALAQGIPVVALAGCVDYSNDLETCGFSAILPIVAGPIDIESAMRPEVARNNMKRTAAAVAKLLTLKTF